MSLISTITTHIVGAANIEGIVEKIAADEGSKLLAPHAHVEDDEVDTMARRCEDMAACLRAGKTENALRDYLQLGEDLFD